MKRVLKKAVRLAGVERHHVAPMRMCCERNIIAALGRARKRYIGRILCYYSIGQSEWGVNDVTPQQFRKQLETALDAGFNFVPASACHGRFSRFRNGQKAATDSRTTPC